jgi:outer membrane protein assembly factor BamB
MPRPALPGLIVLLLVGPLAAADWPQLLGPRRNGVSTETGLRTSWPRQGPPLVWQKDVGAGFSGPVVVGRRLILFHRLKDEEVVECLDALTGDRKWNFAYPTDYQDDFGMDEGPRSTPTVAGSRVYTLGAAGVLHCLDLATGKKVWRRSVNEEYQVRKGYFGVGTSPLVEANLLLVNVGGKKAGIVAFDKDNGKEVWRATDDAASYSSPVAATVAGKRSVFFFTRRGLVVLDPRTGAVRFDKFWRSRMDASVNAATPVVVGDDVFVSACYGTGALLLHFGKGEPKEVWKGDEVLSNHYATSVHRGGYLYGFDGRQEQRARLRCVELKTGKVCWTKEEFGCGSMILADGQLIILSEDGDLLLVEATSAAYREKARARLLTSPCRAQIALADGRLYARDGKKLVCVELRK